MNYGFNPTIGPSFQATPPQNLPVEEQKSSTLKKVLIAGGLGIAAVAAHKTYKLDKIVKAAVKENKIASDVKFPKLKAFWQNCNPRNWFGKAEINGSALDDTKKIFNVDGDVVVLNGKKQITIKKGEPVVNAEPPKSSGAHNTGDASDVPATPVETNVTSKTENIQSYEQSIKEKLDKAAFDKKQNQKLLPAHEGSEAPVTPVETNVTSQTEEIQSYEQSIKEKLDKAAFNKMKNQKLLPAHETEVIASASQVNPSAQPEVVDTPKVFPPADSNLSLNLEVTPSNTSVERNIRKLSFKTKAQLYWANCLDSIGGKLKRIKAKSEGVVGVVSENFGVSRVSLPSPEVKIIDNPTVIKHSGHQPDLKLQEKYSRNAYSAKVNNRIKNSR